MVRITCPYCDHRNHVDVSVLSAKAPGPLDVICSSCSKVFEVYACISVDYEAWKKSDAY